uniref:Uncharacterized protein n=1 Tax=Arundo donax TaxID=35708 RepID=A0A0A9FIM4_ARUDO
MVNPSKDSQHFQGASFDII